MADTNNITELEFPHSIVLKASAGSGKTHALTRRFVIFILSDSIKKKSLRNILAITFSNNAAAEMRARILQWLKALSLGREQEIRELHAATGLSEDQLINRAEVMLSVLLEHYADLQVRTIDSFMTGIFKASAIDLGYNPDFEVVLQSDALMEYSFDMFLKNVKDRSRAGGFLEEMTERILELKPQASGFPWDPSALILEEIKIIYRRAAGTWKTIRARDLTSEIADAKKMIRSRADALDTFMERSGLERNSRSAFPAILGLVRQDRFPDMLEKGIKMLPVKVYRGKDGQKELCYQQIASEWQALTREISIYTALHAESFYYPFFRVYEAVRETIERIKRKEETVFIEDINRTLAEYISSEIVPEVYFRIGETVYHYLIDEFQDTSPVQWKSLLPLVENSLSEYGSLFVVGDTKQAIYGFRDADYRIMRQMEETKPFPSATHRVEELDTNYRSLQQIIDFNEKVFKQNIASDEEYGGIAGLSGLTDYIQKVKPGNEEKGHVQTMILEKEGDETPERARLQQLLAGLLDRGYSLRDIAILTFENDDVVSITAWLNQQSIPFISYSSLDIRRRKVIVEIIALLRFLDCPLDDLSFSTVILGDMFGSILGPEGIAAEQMHRFIFQNRGNRPLYKAFQDAFPDLWESFFSDLFRSVGYLPLYDLVTGAFRVFRIFSAFREEEAALAKMLEVVKGHEQSGRNSLRDFIEFVADQDRNEADWNIDLPKEMEAVRVMTVHKAKGLGFPVVILLLYGRQSKGFSHVLKETGKTGELCLTRLTRKMAEIVEELGGLYQELSSRETVNALNSLYVALTRAGSEMYILCVQNASKKEKQHVCKFLPHQDYPALAMPSEIYPGESRQSRKVELKHARIRAFEAVMTERSLNLKERKWGEYIHRILSFVDIWHKGDELILEGIIKRVDQEYSDRYADRDVFRLVAGFLGCPDIRHVFSAREGRLVKRETEIADSRGNLFRIDRLVMDPDGITVIDFKTGRDLSGESAYLDQVRQYMRILSDIYPDQKIRGMIAYVELAQARIVP